MIQKKNNMIWVSIIHLVVHICNPDDLFSMFFGGGGRGGFSTNIGPDVQFFSNIPNFRSALQKPIQ